MIVLCSKSVNKNCTLFYTNLFNFIISNLKISPEYSLLYVCVGVSTILKFGMCMRAVQEVSSLLLFQEMLQTYGVEGQLIEVIKVFYR